MCCVLSGIQFAHQSKLEQTPVSMLASKIGDIEHVELSCLKISVGWHAWCFYVFILSNLNCFVAEMYFYKYTWLTDWLTDAAGQKAMWQKHRGELKYSDNKTAAIVHQKVWSTSVMSLCDFFLLNIVSKLSTIGDKRGLLCFRCLGLFCDHLCQSFLWFWSNFGSYFFLLLLLLDVKWILKPELCFAYLNWGFRYANILIVHVYSTEP